MDKKCVPCTAGQLALTGSELKKQSEELEDGWTVVSEHHLEKSYSFKNFKDALAFVNVVGQIAEDEGHHPNFHLSWGAVKIELYTHKVNGLTPNDFILATLIDAAHVGHFG